MDDEGASPNTEEKLALNNAETIRMKLEDTLAVNREEFEPNDKSEATDTVTLDTAKDTPKDESSSDSRWGKKKKEPGKLPPVPKMSEGNSTTAADDVLRKFFNRG